MRLPKSIIKKYGISKKAWSVFRGQRTHPAVHRVKTRTTRRVKYMAKRRGHRSSKSFGGMSRGMLKPSGLVLGALLGIGAAALADKIIPNVNFAYKHEVAGFLAGGVAGAGAVLLLKNIGGTGATGGNIFIN